MTNSTKSIQLFLEDKEVEYLNFFNLMLEKLTNGKSGFLKQFTSTGLVNNGVAQYKLADKDDSCLEEDLLSLSGKRSMTDTAVFYKENQDVILALAVEEAEKQNVESVVCYVEYAISDMNLSHQEVTFDDVVSGILEEIPESHYKNPIKLLPCITVCNLMCKLVVDDYLEYLNAEEEISFGHFANDYARTRANDGPYGFLLTRELAEVLILSFSKKSKNISPTGYIPKDSFREGIQSMNHHNYDVNYGQHDNSLGIKGHKDLDITWQIWKEHKVDILNFVKRFGQANGHSSVIETIHKIIGQKSITDIGLSVDEVAESLYNIKAKKFHGRLVLGIDCAIYLAIEYLCNDYSEFEEYMTEHGSWQYQEPVFTGSIQVKPKCKKDTKALTHIYNLLSIIGGNTNLKGLMVKTFDAEQAGGIKTGTYPLLELITTVSRGMANKSDGYNYSINAEGASDKETLKTIIIHINKCIQDIRINKLKSHIIFSDDSDHAFIAGTYSLKAVLESIAIIARRNYVESYF